MTPAYSARVQPHYGIKGLMKRLYITGLAALMGLTSLSSAAQAQSNSELYVVMFRADWCAPCKIVEPSIAQALTILNDPSIESLTIDITTPAHSEISAHKAFDRNIVSQYNSWLGVTGFGAIIDATNKQTLGCVNLKYSPQDMATHIRNLKTYAVADQVAVDFTCPEPNN